jgi:hypothetical protein
LQTCLESGLNGDIWFLADEEHLAMLQEEAPQMTRVVGVSSSDLPDATALLDLHYEIVNVDTGITTKEIQAYRDKGLGVNVYTIDEPWLFSQYWLSGVTSVTTNNVQSFSQLQKPYLNLSYSRYLLFWGVYGIILAIWLASSQPGPERGPEKPVTTPDLMDFALEDERLEAMGAEPVTPEPEPVDEVIEPVGDEVEEPVVEDDAGEDVLSADSWSKVEADEEGTEDNKENEENDEAES